MLFWISAAVLTLLAILAVVVPLVRRESTDGSEIEFDKAIYHARVTEIEKDRDLGRITEDAAKLALAEEGRKLIALADKQAGTPAPVGVSSTRIAAGLAFLLIPAATLAMYVYLGNPGMQDQTLASRMNAAPEGQSIDELVARAEGHLSNNPDDARGWAVIAPVYARMGRYEDVVQALSNVYRLKPQTPEIRANLAEAMINAANGVVTEAAQKLFQEELTVNFSSAKARFYLAMALGQEGRHKEAIIAWDELIAGGTSQSPWMEAALNFRQRSATEVGDPSIARAPDIVSAPAAPGNPTREEIEAAAGMSAEDRQEMISNMVAGLAEKLKDDPFNKEMWQRLIRSYIVLGQTEKAKETLDSAYAAFQGDEAFQGTLNEFRAMLDTSDKSQNE